MQRACDCIWGLVARQYAAESSGGAAEADPRTLSTEPAATSETAILRTRPV
jgi:hypothetical protein